MPPDLGPRGSGSPSSIVFARFATMGLALGTAPLIARAIGPAGRGEVAASMMTATLIPLAVSLGVPLAVRVYTAAEGGTGFLRAGRRFAWTTLPLCVLLGLAAKLTVLTTLSTAATVAFLCYASMGALFVHALCDQSFLMVQRRYLHIAILQSSQIVVATVAICALWLNDALDVPSVLWAQSTGQVAAFASGVILVGAQEKTEIMGFRALLRKSVRFSGIQIAEAAAQRLDQVVMVPIIGATQAGFYALASTLASIPIALGHALGSVYFSAFARVSNLDIAGLARRTIRISFALCSLFAGVLAVAAIPVVPWLFGDPFRPAVVPTLIALAGSPLLVSGYIGAQALTARSDGHRVTAAYVIGTVVGLVALVPLGHAMGAEGAALAAIVGYGVTLLLVCAPQKGGLSSWIPRPSDFRDLMADVRAH